MISKDFTPAVCFQDRLLSTAPQEGAGTEGAEVTGQDLVLGRQSTVLEEKGAWDNNTPKHQFSAPSCLDR